MQLTKDFGVFSRTEAAKFLGGICLTTLNRLKIPKLKIRRRVFYRLEDLKNWVFENTNFSQEEKR